MTVLTDEQQALVGSVLFAVYAHTSGKPAV